jgi:S1-C subfamily serine protease
VSGDPESKEARIAAVKDRSPAERYGLQAGDVVIALDGRQIADFASLVQAVDNHNPNDSIVLRVRRGSEQLDIRIRLGRKLDE